MHNEEKDRIFNILMKTHESHDSLVMHYNLHIYDVFYLYMNTLINTYHQTLIVYVRLIQDHIISCFKKSDTSASALSGTLFILDTFVLFFFIDGPSLIPLSTDLDDISTSREGVGHIHHHQYLGTRHP